MIPPIQSGVKPLWMGLLVGMVTMSRASRVALLLRQLLLDIVIHGVGKIAMGSENSIALI
jgi:hypothetical protein